VIFSKDGLEANTQGGPREEPTSGEEFEPGPSSGSGSPGTKFKRFAEKMRIVL
jgi:hypothetical protein